MAAYFQMRVRETKDKTIIYSAAILRHNIPTDELVSNIISQAAKILFVAMNDYN